MAAHLQWCPGRIPRTGPGRLPSMGSIQSEHNWSDLAVAPTLSKLAVLSLQLHLTLCIPAGLACQALLSNRTFLAEIMEWVHSSQRESPSRDWTCILEWSRLLTTGPTRKPISKLKNTLNGTLCKNIVVESPQKIITVYNDFKGNHATPVSWTQCLRNLKKVKKK